MFTIELQIMINVLCNVICILKMFHNDVIVMMFLYFVITNIFTIFGQLENLKNNFWSIGRILFDVTRHANQ